MPIIYPLSCGKELNVKNMVALISSAQTREKGLKVFQYIAKSSAFILLRVNRGNKTLMVEHFETLSKTLSTARRFFKLCRWIKHFEDIQEAREEENPWVSRLFYLDILCNIVADMSEDLTSLNKVAILPKGILPARIEYYSNFPQLVLAVVELTASAVKAHRARKKYEKKPGPALEAKMELARLEHSKFWADLGKAFWDCELSFASEGLFCFCGLWAGMVSTHKYGVKVCK